MPLDLPLPENCPPKLRAVIEKHEGRRHRIAKELQINVYWVQMYIRHGHEPTNQETRAKMHLPKTTRAPRRPNYRAPHLNWWRHLSPSQREEWIKSAHEAATGGQ